LTGNILRRRIIFSLVIMIGLVIIGSVLFLAFYHPQRPANVALTNLPSIRAMRVDYLDEEKSRGEVAGLEAQMRQAGVNLVAVAAGRVDWTYFPWRGYRDRWSDDVKHTGIDYLLGDSNRFSKWAHVSAVFDVLAPIYIQAHPEAASISWLGVPSKNIVGTMELVEGQYSHDLLDMIDEVATYYPVNSITITELEYYVDGFGEQDKVAYMAYTGRVDWPRTADGMIDIDESSIGIWRTYEIGRFLEKAVTIVKSHGKQLFLEVHIDADPSGQVLIDNGTDFNHFLSYVDRLVVRDGSDPDDRSLSFLKTIRQYLSTFPKNRIITCISLWSKDYPPETTRDQMLAFSASDFQSVLQGIGSDLWITPSFMMSDAHWQVLKDFWNVQP
jgi:hypothetical protein